MSQNKCRAVSFIPGLHPGDVESDAKRIDWINKRKADRQRARFEKNKQNELKKPNFAFGDVATRMLWGFSCCQVMTIRSGRISWPSYGSCLITNGLSCKEMVRGRTCYLFCLNNDAMSLMMDNNRETWKDSLRAICRMLQVVIDEFLHNDAKQVIVVLPIPRLAVFRSQENFRFWAELVIDCTNHLGRCHFAMPLYYMNLKSVQFGPKGILLSPGDQNVFARRLLSDKDLLFTNQQTPTVDSLIMLYYRDRDCNPIFRPKWRRSLKFTHLSLDMDHQSKAEEEKLEDSKEMLELMASDLDAIKDVAPAQVQQPQPAKTSDLKATIGSLRRMYVGTINDIITLMKLQDDVPGFNLTVYHLVEGSRLLHENIVKLDPEASILMDCYEIQKARIVATETKENLLHSSVLTI